MLPRSRYHWRKSSYSNEANCVEIGTHAGASPVMVRDTKDRSAVLSFDRGTWRKFLDNLR